MIVTLDTWFTAANDSVRQVANLAAEIGTERSDIGDDPTSVWAGDQYGGRVESIKSIPGATLALNAELQRIVNSHSIDGTVITTSSETTITAGIKLTAAGLEAADG